MLSSRRSRRHREAVEVSRGRTGRLWRLRAAHLHRPQQSGQLRHHPTTKMWSWRWRSGRRRGAAPLPVCPFESSCRSCTVTQDPWVRAEGAVRGGPRRRVARTARAHIFQSVLPLVSFEKLVRSNGDDERSSRERTKLRRARINGFAHRPRAKLTRLFASAT